MKNTIHAVACQFDMKLFDKAYNLAKMKGFTEAAKKEYNADLIVFPEASLTGYCFENADEVRSVAEPVNGDSVRSMSKIAQDNEITVVFGMVELADNGLFYNDVICCQKDGSVQVYHKSHLPLLGLDRFVTRGDELVVTDTDFGPMGMICCYDMRFPETVRTEALKGARIVVHATNLPPAGKSYPEFLNRARACENRIFIISANRIGDERGFHFIGNSQIIDFGGNVLAEMGEEEGMIAAELDLSLTEQKDIIVRPGIHEMHLFSDRNPLLYNKIVEKN